MVKRTKQKIKIFFLFLSTFFLLSCANQLPPGGGEVDKIPPTIVHTYPENGTTNFKDNSIEIEFSEYVDKRTFKEALFISPAFDEQPDISWTGTTVTIEFPEKLKKDFTYVVTIGTDVVDINNKNRMANSYSFSFSTGDKIDTRWIAGRVFGKENEGVLIFAYKFSDDTTNYLAKKPEYISQTGKDGSYKLNGLAESVYRLFAVKDQLRDFKYQADQDLIGMPYKNVSLMGEDSSFTGMDFLLTKIDTLKPRLISSVMTDKYHILVTLSKDCDSSIYNADNYFIIDSTNNEKLNIQYCFKGNTKEKEFILEQTNNLNIENRYYLFAKKLKDLNDNIFEDDWRELIVSDRVDTTSPKLFKEVPDKNAKIDFLNPKILFYFDDAVKNESIKSAVQFEDTLKNKIDFQVYFPDDATLLIKPVKDLKPDKDFIIKLNLSKFVDPAGNKTDSIFTLKFSTISGIEFTGLSGRITTSMQNIVLILQNISTTNLLYTAKPDKTSNYTFKRIEPGKYNLWLFVDKDSTGKYDYGYPEPFKYAEQFYFYPDTINLKPRWSITDFNLNTNK